MILRMPLLRTAFSGMSAHAARKGLECSGSQLGYVASRMAHGGLSLGPQATIADVESFAISRVLRLHTNKSGMS